MAAHDASVQHPGDLKHSRDAVAANLIDGSGCGTLIVDARGRICGCGVAAEDIFVASQSRLIGRQVAEFIAGIFPKENSSPHNAVNLDRLCETGAWEAFEATDARGCGFAVEIHVSRRVKDEQEMFVLSLRQPGDTSCP